MISIKGSLWLCHTIFSISIIEGVCNMKAPCIGMEGKMLPSVTTEDNGDVLMVVDGEWSKGETSGGDGVTIFTDTVDEATQTDTLNATYQEVSDASFAVLVSTSDMGSGNEVTYYLTLTEKGVADGQYWATFGEASFWANSPNEPMTNPPPEG